MFLAGDLLQAGAEHAESVLQRLKAAPIEN
jgi:hypothetical protein